jgi:hypothetical protein
MYSNNDILLDQEEAIESIIKSYDDSNNIAQR